MANAQIRDAHIFANERGYFMSGGRGREIHKILRRLFLRRRTGMQDGAFERSMFREHQKIFFEKNNSIENFLRHHKHARVVKFSITQCNILGAFPFPCYTSI